MRVSSKDSAHVFKNLKCKQTGSDSYTQDIIAFADAKSTQVCKRVLVLAIFFGYLLQADCKEMNETERPNSMIDHVNYDDLSPVMSDSEALNDVPSANVEQQSSGLDSSQFRASRFHIVQDVTDSSVHDKIGSHDTTPSILDGMDSLGATFVKGEQRSPQVISLARQENPSSSLDMEKQEVDSTPQNTVSCDDTNVSRQNSTNLLGVFLVEREQQVSGLITPPRRENRSSRLDAKKQALSPTTYKTNTNEGIDASTLNKTDVFGSSLADGEQQSPGLNSLPRQDSQSSISNLAKHGLNFTTHNTISNNDTTSAAFNGSDLTRITVVKLASEPDFAPKQGRMLVEANTPQNLGTRMKSLFGQNQAVAGSTYPLGALRKNEGYWQGWRQSINLGSIFKGGNTPLGLERERPHESNGDSRSEFGRMSQESLQTGVDKLRQLTRKETMNSIISRTKPKDLPGSQMRSIMEALQRALKDDYVQKVFGSSVGVKPGQYLYRPASKRFRPEGRFSPDQDRFRPDRDHFRPDQDQFRPKKDRFKLEKDRFWPVQGRSSPDRDRFRPERDQFRPVKDRARPDNDYGFRPYAPPVKSNNEGTKVSAGDDIFSEFQLLSLQAHNQYRDKHGVPSLSLNKGLCVSAQAYANELARTDPEEKMDHSPPAYKGMYGENLAATRGYVVTGRAAVDDWYNEIYNYDFNTCWAKNPREDFSHFTQVIWKNSKQMGTGYATNARGNTYVVCHYFPHGNTKGEFQENVPRPRY